MAKITYVDWRGRSTTVDLASGWSLMQGAVSNGVEGIVGECGGSCACATCHCYVDEARLADLPFPDDTDRDARLGGGRSAPNSRLSCQIKATPAIDGLVVHLPETQG